MTSAGSDVIWKYNTLTMFCGSLIKKGCSDIGLFLTQQFSLPKASPHLFETTILKSNLKATTDAHGVHLHRVINLVSFEQFHPTHTGVLMVIEVFCRVCLNETRSKANGPKNIKAGFHCPFCNCVAFET